MAKTQLPKQKKAGFILLGNGLSSSFDIGVLKILLKKITPSLIIATSMGASNACYIFKDKNTNENVEKAEKKWLNFDSSGLFRLNKEVFFKPFFAKSLYNNKGLKNVLVELGEFYNKEIQDLYIPIYIGAVNVTTGKTDFFDKGPIFHSLMASCAVPFFFPPYPKDGSLYMDGSLNPRACIDFALEKDLDEIIVINLIKRKARIKSMFSHITHAIDILRTSNIEDISKKNPKLKIIAPNENQLPKSFTDPSKIKDLIKHGEEKAKEFLKTYK